MLVPMWSLTHTRGSQHASFLSAKVSRTWPISRVDVVSKILKISAEMGPVFTTVQVTLLCLVSPFLCAQGWGSAQYS